MYTEQVGLCRRLLGEHYGPIVEAVGAALIRDGRLHLGSVVQRTGLAPGSVRQALAVLIQHGMATHAQTREGGRAVTYYSISPRSILRLQRAGLYLALVEERMGRDGLAVFRTIMLNGCMTAAAARSALGASERSGAAAKAKFGAAVAKLVRERFITAVAPRDTVTRADRIMQEEAKEIAKLGAPATPKDLARIRQAIRQQEAEESSSTAIVGLKRSAAAAADDGGPAKVLIGPDGRPIMLGNGLDGHGHGDGQGGGGGGGDAQPDTVDDKQCFRVYYERLDVFLRNKQIVNYFSDKYNAAAGVVLKAALRLTEAHTRTCRDRVSERITANQIIQGIPHDAPLEDGVDTGDIPHSNGSDLSDGSGARRLQRGRAALALLEVLRADASGVLSRADERGAGVFRINFERAAGVLRDKCVDALVVEKHGSQHARIVRVLRDKQKLDEKAVAHFAMLPIDQCRERLHELSLAGFVATVEIPRTADRNPSRMFYLWHVDAGRQVSAALRLVFQGLSNVAQRAAREASCRAPLLAKAQREDVVADPSLLTAPERKELQAATAARRRLDIAAVRLDGMLLVVHDVAPSPVFGT
ncbi:RNA polymerase III subunit C82 [Coemansia javaensis]|uniref:DNA-directed RNA polymerase III subunit RPC3 n=1 Tax=Coemansia javaensis TaxID=2761396 RepID=A0A9W8H642_9FUNG|nr:RNA polymerase III subunit C82 [Coemansia javaensis]